MTGVQTCALPICLRDVVRAETIDAGFFRRQQALVEQTQAIAQPQHGADGIVGARGSWGHGFGGGAIVRTEGPWPRSVAAHRQRGQPMAPAFRRGPLRRSREPSCRSIGAPARRERLLLSPGEKKPPCWAVLHTLFVPSA